MAEYDVPVCGSSQRISRHSSASADSCTCLLVGHSTSVHSRRSACDVSLEVSASVTGRYQYQCMVFPIFSLQVAICKLSLQSATARRAVTDSPSRSWSELVNFPLGTFNRLLRTLASSSVVKVYRSLLAPPFPQVLQVLHKPTGLKCPAINYHWYAEQACAFLVVLALQSLMNIHRSRA